MSAPQVTIYSYPHNPRVWKSLIAAQFNGVSIKYHTEIKMGETNKTEAYVAVNPFGQVPTAFVGDKQEQGVFESNSISRYVARLGESKHNLYGTDALSSSRIDSWLDATASYESAFTPWVASTMGWAQGMPEVQIEKSKENTKKWLQHVENHLAKHTYLEGNGITLADIVVWCALSFAFQRCMNAEYRAQFPHTLKWFTTLAELKEFKNVTGEIKLL